MNKTQQRVARRVREKKDVTARHKLRAESENSCVGRRPGTGETRRPAVADEVRKDNTRNALDAHARTERTARLSKAGENLTKRSCKIASCVWWRLLTVARRGGLGKREFRQQGRKDLTRGALNWPASRTIQGLALPLSHLILGARLSDPLDGHPCCRSLRHV
jgi:hypothetical protein